MMSITKSFDANGALEQVAQICCRIFLLGDLQKLPGNGPGPAQLEQVGPNGLQPQPFCDSVILFLILKCLSEQYLACFPLA